MKRSVSFVFLNAAYLCLAPFAAIGPRLCQEWQGAGLRPRRSDDAQ